MGFFLAFAPEKGEVCFSTGIWAWIMVWPLSTQVNAEYGSDTPQEEVTLGMSTHRFYMFLLQK